MTFLQTLVLGAFAGLTIFAGLPVARWGRPSKRRSAFLNSASVGVLLFILYDVIKTASETVSSALHDNTPRGLGYALLFVVGLGTGLLGLVVYERTVIHKEPTPLPSGPGALRTEEMVTVVRTPMNPAQRVALLIAVGIGLHNFSEGLAIGQSAAGGVYRLFFLLVIGFGLHNTTEGFGITAPLFGQKPSWRFLALCGIIGGGPTFIGTLVGYTFVSAAVSVVFLALAAGAIMYVVGELQHAGRKIGNHDVAMVGLFSGFVIAYGTDLLLQIGGA